MIHTPYRAKPRCRRRPTPKWHPVGEKNPRAILTEQLVREIRARLRDGEGRYALAREFDCTPSNIQAIGTGRSWTHVE